MTTILSVVSLTISVVTLVYLIKYVRATYTIAKQSIRQVEATFRPAIVCLPGTSLDSGPSIRNIGNGPAIDIEWSLAPNRGDKIPYLESSRAQSRFQDWPLRVFENMKPFFETTAPMVINYKSISGATYCSTCTYNAERGEFSTTFAEH